MEWETLETFTGTREVTLPGSPVTTETVTVKDINVRFVHNGVTHERPVNVCWDSDGNYDHEATLVRCQEMANGVENKINLGVIVNPEPAEPAE